MSEEHDITADKRVVAAVRVHIEQSHAAARRGNARFVRNLFEEMYRTMASRAVADGEIGPRELTRFTMADVPVASAEDRDVVTGFQPNPPSEQRSA